MYIIYFKNNRDTLIKSVIFFEIQSQGLYIGQNELSMYFDAPVEDVDKIITAYGVQIYPEKKEKLIQAFVK